MEIPRDTNSYKPNIVGFGVRIVKNNDDNCKLDINRKYPIAISRVNITKDLELLRTLDIHVWGDDPLFNTNYLLEGYKILCEAIRNKFIDNTLTKPLNLMIDDSLVDSSKLGLLTDYSIGVFRISIRHK